MEDRVEYRGRGVAAERQRSGRHLVQNHPQREQVRPQVQRLAEGLLRRHVGHCPESSTWARQVLLARRRRAVQVRGGLLTQHRQAEVQHLRLPSRGDEDVRRLHVAVHDPLAVGGVESVGDVQAEVQKLLGLKPPGEDAVLQCLPLQAFHDDEGLPLVLADVVDGADVGMIQGRGGLRLTLEALTGGRVAEVGLGEELQRDVAVEAGVLTLVDDAHASAAELLDHAVVRDGLADHWEFGRKGYNIASRPAGELSERKALSLPSSRVAPATGGGG